jgi:hypothetical protein
METEMRKTSMFAMGAIASLFIAPVLAAEPVMLKPGASMMVMPNGQTMMTAPMTGDMDPAMKSAAKPMDKCMIMMMGTDGKMYMMEDMAMADGKMACDTMSKM